MGPSVPEAETQHPHSRASIPPKFSKACRACHERKLRCDAPAAGLPCTRCTTKGLADHCEQVRRQTRRRKILQTPQSRQKLPLSINRPQTQPAAAGAAASISQPIETSIDTCAVPTERLPTQDEQASMQVCQEMATGPGPNSDKTLEPTSPGRDLVEYHNGTHYLSILGEVISQTRRRRLTRIIVEDAIMQSAAGGEMQITCNNDLELSGLNDADKDYLSKKEVLCFPPKSFTDILLQCYFEFVYPPLPIFNRIEFMQSYELGQCSSFLLHTLLASGALYAPVDLFPANGFTDRNEAHAAFASKATLLYDFRCERSQMRMLQGSLILGTNIFTYSLDKDFRYWFHNAVRLAVKMGLHRNEIIHDMDPTTYKLCKRIWWVIYCRDVLFSFIGSQNMRIVNDDYDTVPLTVEDWEEEILPERFASVLSPITFLQRLCVVENCKLAKIAAKCLAMLKSGKGESLDDLAGPFASWRASLLETIQLNQDSQASDDVWHTVLLATSYRFECILFRLLRMWWQPRETKRYIWAKQRLRASLFELDTIVGRASANNTLSNFPLSFISCVPTILALHIEITSDSSEPELVRSMSHNFVRQDMLLLKRLAGFPIIQRTLPVFRWVLAQKGLLSAIDMSIYASEAESSEAQANPSVQRSPAQDLTVATLPIEDATVDPWPWLDDVLGFDFLDNLDLSGL